MGLPPRWAAGCGLLAEQQLQEQGSANQMQMCLQKGLRLQHTVRGQSMGTPEGASQVQLAGTGVAY